MLWLGIAVAKSGAGFLAWLAILWQGQSLSTPLPPVFHVLLLVTFTSTGLVLVQGAPRDGAARWLGLVFCLFSSTFADRPLDEVAIGAPAADALRRVLGAVPPAAFIPAYFWRFAWGFPRLQPALVPAWSPALVSRTTFAAGGVLFALVTISSFVSSARPEGARNIMWTTIVLLLMPAVGVLAAKVQTALPEERRRVGFFITGLVIGMTPVMLDVMLNAFVPAYRAFAAAHRQAVAIVLATGVLVIPIVTAYAVVVERVLETRLVVRMAIQYALARYAVLGFVTIPLVFLARHVYLYRREPIVDVVAQAPPSVWVAVIFAVCLGWARRPLRLAIDRRYFREQYDARVILATLTDRTRQVESLEQLAALVAAEIDRALHVQRVSLLVRRGNWFEDPVGATPRLPAAATLVTLTVGSTSALSLDLSDPLSPLRRLPPPEGDWLSTSRARLLLPLIGPGQDIRGLLFLGEKRSEASYTAEDRFLLQTVAASTVLALEQLLRPGSASAPAEGPLPGTGLEERPAVQCGRCGRVFEPGTTTCDACGLPLAPAAVPLCVAGKFRVLCRLGAGGMGIVYKGEDLVLGRLVAIKTLPQLSESAGRRLRREARALATVLHPNLEIIHGVESWHGVPMLILEYLAGGTLAARLTHERLEIGAVVQIGMAMTEALHGLHRVGVLHRDVKPSNIGFTADGVPKLLDFGLAIVAAPDAAQAAPHGDATTRTHPLRAPDGGMSSVAVAGTPLYMSPEALSGGQPEVAFDLWALAVTIFEALAGQHPFRASSRAETARLIVTGTLPDLRGLRPDCPVALADLLIDALSLDRSRRPRSARELGARLADVGW